MSAAMSDDTGRVRLDKWLWAARFFKTRSLAKQAIEGGKVHYDGQRCKVSKEVEIGATLNIRQGLDDWEIVVQALSAQRRGAPEARLLYAETPASAARRDRSAAERRSQRLAGLIHSSDRPTKKQRRQIHQFKRDNESG